MLILDDHPIFRVGLADLTRGSSHLEVCGSADCAPAALDAMRHLKLDLVLLDLSLPGTNGIELIKSMKAERPDLAILVISMHDEPIFGVRTLKAGALGYVTKAEAANQVEEAISKVLQGKIYVSPEFGVQLIFKAVQSGKARTSSLKCHSREFPNGAARSHKRRHRPGSGGRRSCNCFGLNFLLLR